MFSKTLVWLRERSGQVQVQVVSDTARGRVAATVAVDGDQAEGSALTLASSQARDPGDDLEARSRFDALVAPHLSALRARAIQLCRSHYDSDDVVQDALLRAFLTGSQARDPTRIRAWLLMIVTNTFLDLIRKRRRRPDHVQLVSDAPTPDPIEPAPWDHVDSDDLRRAIDQLPDDVRDTYRMFAVEGCGYAAICEVQQIPSATVGSRLFRARKRLRLLLTPASPGGTAAG
jgi:RNA polymerase sigma-70 factor (ECF subfamily)